MKTFCSCWPFLAILVCAATPIPSFAQNLSTLVSFNVTNGANPADSLVQGADGYLYGTTTGGGQNGSGNIFKVANEGAMTVLYSFCADNYFGLVPSFCTDGSGPAAGLVQATDGNFYGVTVLGGINCIPEGAQGCGTVFRMTPSGALTTLYRFCSQANCTDGTSPKSALIQANDGNLYGTTAGNGSTSYGTIFRLTLDGTLSTLYNFSGPDGALPLGALTQGMDGALYGTTEAGGSSQCPFLAQGCGTVFKITLAGTLTTLHNFNSADGASPWGGVQQASNGYFYGTTAGGGAYSNCAGGPCGTLFQIAPDGGLTTLYNFCALPNCSDGASPETGLYQATDGNLYGGTIYGGSLGNYGTIFQITPTGALTTVHQFDAMDGDWPNGTLLQATDGSLYGTTFQGGQGGPGTVFSFSMGLGPFVKTLPSYGESGSAVVILGTNLSSASSVNFNGVGSAFSVLSPSEIVALVPSGASTGVVEVTTPNGTLFSNLPFNVEAPTGGCTVNASSNYTVANVQLMIDEALGLSPAANDLNGDGVINIVDVQISISTALGTACSG
jgi:uncharacterized repeat protein (TIGR03803 family)